MYPITSYKITPNLFGVTRWMAEVDGQHSLYARRAYSRDAAERKISRDENLLHETGKRTFMQRVILPWTHPLRGWHDRICRAAEQRRRARRVRTNRPDGSRDD